MAPSGSPVGVFTATDVNLGPIVMLDVRTGCRLVETAELEDAKCANRVDWRDKVLITPYFGEGHFGPCRVER